MADLRGTNYYAFVGEIPFGDKIGHFLLMGVFSFLLNPALNAKTFQFFRFNCLLGSLMVFGLVTIEEFSQIFISGRTFDLKDLFFDYAGIYIFGELARFIFRKIVRA